MLSVAALLSLFTLAGAWSTDPTNPYNLPPVGYVPNATLGPPLELWHEFWNGWPTGIAVSKSGRIFANFPLIGDPLNFTVGELISPTEEVAFPNASYNTPPFVYNTSNPSYGAGYIDKLISVQSVVIDPLDRLWLLDTGRPIVGPVQLLNSGFGPKLVGVDLTTNQTFKTITFPTTVVYPETLLNDVRFDLRPNITSSGGGVAYITDSSDEGRNGIIVVDLGTGESWRHLDRHPSVTADPGFLAAYDGIPFQPVHPVGGPQGGSYAHFTTGADGIALGADGEYLYYSPLSARRFYRIATSLLRVPAGGAYPSAEIQAVAGVQFLGQHASHADGLETSSDGTIYVTAHEQNGIFTYSPTTGLFSPLVRDPRIQWPDTMSVGFDNYLYFTSNQWWLQPSVNNGTDYRVKPYGLFRFPINGTKVILT